MRVKQPQRRLVMRAEINQNSTRSIFNDLKRNLLSSQLRLQENAISNDLEPLSSPPEETHGRQTKPFAGATVQSAWLTSDVESKMNGQTPIFMTRPHINIRRELYVICQATTTTCRGSFRRAKSTLPNSDDIIRSANILQ